MMEITEYQKINGNIPGDETKHLMKTITVAANSTSTFTYNVPSGYTFHWRYSSATNNPSSTYQFKKDGLDISEDDEPKSEPIQEYGDNTRIFYPTEECHNTCEIIINNNAGSSQTYNVAINGFLRH